MSRIRRNTSTPVIRKRVVPCHTLTALHFGPLCGISHTYKITSMFHPYSNHFTSNHPPFPISVLCLIRTHFPLPNVQTETRSKPASFIIPKQKQLAKATHSHCDVVSNCAKTKQNKHYPHLFVPTCPPGPGSRRRAATARSRNRKRSRASLQPSKYVEHYGHVDNFDVAWSRKCYSPPTPCRPLTNTASAKRSDDLPQP